jgi:hypothetical protein
MTQKALHNPIFQDVLDRFKKDLSKKEKDYFTNVTSFDELEKSIGDLQERQTVKRQARNLERLSPFLEAIKQWGQVVEVFCNSSEFVAFVWVSSHGIYCQRIIISLFLGPDQICFAGMTLQITQGTLKQR